MVQSGRKHKAFTLVEILIVVLILGIIAAVVLPRFSSASATARVSMMSDDLRVIRTQIAVFKSQHRGVSPGYPQCDTNQEPTEGAFAEFMTQASNSAGESNQTRSSLYPYGPYLSEMPENPVNGKTTVEIIGDGEELPDAGDDSHGWIYQPYTLTFKSDASGTDDTGKSFVDY